MVRKTVYKISDEDLQVDLERFRKRALEMGCTDAKVITTDMVLIDERVRAKCVYPKCAGYGTNANCPPHAMDLEQVRKVVGSYRYAIFTRTEVSTVELAGPNVIKNRQTIPSQIKNHEIISRLEAEAFYDGYYLALGFANGCCKFGFCPNEACSALEVGKSCRHPLRGRSSMEAVGMDVFGMAASVGWDCYPIGAGVLPDEVPSGARMGLLLFY